MAVLSEEDGAGLSGEARGQAEDVGEGGLGDRGEEVLAVDYEEGGGHCQKLQWAYACGESDVARPDVIAGRWTKYS